MADAAGAGEAGAASLGDDFGQRVDLTVRLRELLRSYPEGTSVLRELAQNADDAGARSFALLLDLRTHAAASLFAPGMRALHAAPALLAYNDAAFTARDFAAIQRIGDSSKREESKGQKVGRFGLDIVWAAIVLASIAGIAFFALVSAAEARLLPRRS